jgi:oligopeptide/dipeptide ABC transporter ATP-binding protein
MSRPANQAPATEPATDGAILSVRGLRRYFPVRSAFGRRVGWLRAVDDVSFEVGRGEILGLVGESGCGKSTLGKTVIGIHPPTAGEIHFEGREIGGLPKRERRRLARHLQYVYQDPGASLDPRWKVKRSLHEPLVIHTSLSRAEREQRVQAMLRAVGLPDAHLDLYPHELSGGQQRRVGLARILTLQPSLIILDEPTSGLDVSVQATILKLLRGLQDTFALTYLFISHDLAVVRMMCHRVAVMYLGTLIEIGDTAAVFDSPRHPYTRSLISAIPRIGGRRLTREFWLEGEPPDPGALPSGCRFRTRCPLARDVCATDEPPFRLIDGRLVACHFAESGVPLLPLPPEGGRGVG